MLTRGLRMAVAAFGLAILGTFLAVPQASGQAQAEVAAAEVLQEEVSTQATVPLRALGTNKCLHAWGTPRFRLTDIRPCNGGDAHQRWAVKTTTCSGGPGRAFTYEGLYNAYTNTYLQRAFFNGIPKPVVVNAACHNLLNGSFLMVGAKGKPGPGVYLTAGNSCLRYLANQPDILRFVGCSNINSQGWVLN